MLQGYILCYGFKAAINEKYELIMYLSVLVYLFLFNSSLYCIFLGMFAQFVFDKIKDIYINNICLYVLLIACIMTSPLLFDGSNSDMSIKLFGTMFAIIVILISYEEYNSNLKISSNILSTIKILSGRTFSFYLVHVFVLSNITPHLYNVIYSIIMSDKAVIVVVYPVTLFLTYIVAIAFDEIIIKRLTKSICEKLIK
jgi:peptidoglycan/LPS O-acetylase OafA/YrhL